MTDPPECTCKTSRLPCVIHGGRVPVVVQRDVVAMRVPTPTGACPKCGVIVNLSEVDLVVRECARCASIQPGKV